MKEFKDYPVITSEEFDEKKMYMIIDVLDIFYKNYIRNSKESVNIVLHFFEEFSKENGIPCGNLYMASFENKGEFIGYYGCCDGLPDDSEELEKIYGTDYSEEFSDYCDKIGLDLDYYIEDND